MLSNRTSPTSAIRHSEKGSTPVSTLILRTTFDLLRISRGPWRAPGWKVTPWSVGTPTSAMSRPSSVVASGARRSVAPPMKRRSSSGR